MGYEDRDYMRSESGGGDSSIMPGYPACRWLIFITIGVFIIQIFATRTLTHRDMDAIVLEHASDQQLSEEEIQELAYSVGHSFGNISVIEEWCELKTSKVEQGQIWRLLTCAFLHSRFGVWHILINMLMLYWFGRDLEDMFGSREFLLFYLTAAVFASILFVGLQMFLHENIPAIGASGAVMAVMCLYTMYNPTQEIFFRFFIPIQMRFLLLFYVIFDLHPVLLKLAGTPMATGTAHAAHLGGLLFGYLYYRFPFRLERYYLGISSTVSRWLGRRNEQTPWEEKQGMPYPTRVRKSPSQVERLERSLDEILKKIRDQGEDSLTEKERIILDEASKHYREKQAKS